MAVQPVEKNARGLTAHLPKIAIGALALAVLAGAAKNHRTIAGNLGAALTNWSSAAASTAAQAPTIDTQHYDLQMTWLGAPDDPGVGGAMTAIGDDVILITRLGALYALDEAAGRFTPLGMEAPNPVALEGFYTRQKDKDALGYKDIVARKLDGGGIELLVSQARAHSERGCVDVSAHRAVLDGGLRADDVSADWREVWSSSPCLESAPGTFPMQAGGELTYLPDGRAAIFVGDMGVDAFNRTTPGADPQADDNSYGKVIAFDPASGAEELISRGHRNPGGLVSAPDGGLWLSEHAAEGGDEINFIRPGGNYGWPVETYTTHYGMKSWPAASDSDDTDFQAPAFAFLPSPALSSLAVSSGEAFPRWEGDLLLGTLKARRIYRVRVHGDDVVLAEPIPLGIRVRDLTVGPGGDIFVKSDKSPRVLRLSRSGSASAPESGAVMALRQAGCLSCHAGWNAAGPNLEGVIGREVASVPDYAYSRALAGAGGAWTPQRLADYLQDPDAVAPGTLMPAADMSRAEIDALVAALMDE